MNTHEQLPNNQEELKDSYYFSFNEEDEGSIGDSLEKILIGFDPKYKSLDHLLKSDTQTILSGNKVRTGGGVFAVYLIDKGSEKRIIVQNINARGNKDYQGKMVEILNSIGQKFV